MIRYVDDISAEEYMELRRKVGWCEFPLEEAQAGLDNAYMILCARDNEKAIGVVRLLWDGGYIAFLSDVIVAPEYQGQGIGRKFVETCIDRIKADAKPGYKVKMCLMAAKEKEPFYRKFGFDERPNDKLGAGMDQWLILGENSLNRLDAEIKVSKIEDPDEKKRISRAVLEDLTDWFGVDEYREEYIEKSSGKLFFAAFDKDMPVGFICLNETGKATAEIYVMGVKRNYHRKGVGRSLFAALKRGAKEAGYSFLQVKTVQMGKYDDYDDTNRFYQSLGFKEFEVFPLLWDEANPCQIYIMSL